MIHALPLALTLALHSAPQGGPLQADLHPKEADAYLEFGDVQGMWKALEQAPIVKVLQDERIKGLLTGLGVQLDSSPKALARRGIEGQLGAGSGAWLDGLTRLSLSVAATGSAGEGAPPFVLTALADFAEPAQAEAVKAALVGKAQEHEPMSAALAGVERLVLGEGLADELWVVVVGPRLILGGGAAKVEDFVARSEKKSPGLAVEVPEAFSRPGGTDLVWFQLARPLADVFEVLQPARDQGIAFLSQLPQGWNPLGARTVRVQMVGDRFVTEMLAAADDHPVKPIETAWLEPVPSGAMLFYSTAVDGAELGKDMRAMLSKDEQQAAALAAIEQKIGFGPERVLARLGPALTVYAMPVAGLGLPETRVWVDCADPAAFQSDLEALLGALGETLPGFSARARPYKVKNDATGEKTEIPVVSISLPQSMSELAPMISLSPSFSPVGKKLVFALSSMEVKNELKRIYGGEGEPIQPGSNPLATLGFKLPEGAQSVVVMDWGKLFAGLINLVKAMAPMLGDSLPFDLAKLPPAEVFTEHFKPTFHFAKPVAGGVYRRNEGSFGPETWLGVVGGAMAAGMRAQSALPAMEIETGAPVTEPVPGESGG